MQDIPDIFLEKYVLYLIRLNTPLCKKPVFKIGKTENLEKRLKSLKREFTCTKDVLLLGALTIESKRDESIFLQAVHDYRIRVKDEKGREKREIFEKNRIVYDTFLDLCKIMKRAKKDFSPRLWIKKNYAYYKKRKC